ncbi:hypothetical protein MASR2M78_03460 [Treponema sp.]
MYNVGIAYTLWLISGFGALGFHRFYLGKPISAIIWMCTGGLGMFGSAYDFLTLSSQVREANIRAEIRAALQGSNNSYSQPMRYVRPSTASWKKKKA